MRGVPWFLLCVVLVLRGPGAAAEGEKAPAAEPSPLARALQSHVAHLAGASLKGRHTWADRNATAAWVAKQLEAAGLSAPPGRSSMLYDQGKERERCRHVLGWLEGSPDPTVNTYVIVTANYDGAGTFKLDTGVTPGANDNASGVASIIETARRLAARERPLHHHILFAVFDHKGAAHLNGPRLYVDTPALPLDRCVAAITVELLGRSFLDHLPGRLFVLGTEFSDALASHVRQGGRPQGGKLAVLRSDFHMESAIYRLFKAQSIPFAYVSGGISLDRHSVRDTVEKLDYAHHAARTRWLGDLVVRVAGAAQRPDWRRPGAPDIEEMRSLRAMFTPIRDGFAKRGFDARTLSMIDALTGTLDKIVERGKVTKMERSMVVLRVGGIAMRAMQLIRPEKR